MQTIIDGLMTILEKSFEALFGLLTAVPSGNKEYSASFASQSTLLSMWNKGFNLSGTKKISLKLSRQNALIVASTGGGKSATVLIPTIFSADASFCINDPSGEIYSKCSARLKEKGYDIKVLNYTQPENSSGYNPIARANTSSEIQKLANTLIENSVGGSKSKDPFWTSLASGLITNLVHILKTQEPDYHNPANLLSLLNKMGGDPDAVDMLFSQYASPEVFNEYKAFVAFDDKVQSGVIATCKSALQLFNDTAISKVTSYDSIDFEGFRKRPTALFIMNKVSDMSYYSSLTAVFFTQFFAYVMSRFPSEKEKDILFLIDEASSLRISTLSVACANVRKHSAGILLAVQSVNQLVNLYGKEETENIKANCYSQVYFAGQNIETCREIEAILGKHEFLDKEGKKVVRPLMTASEVRLLPSDRALLIPGNLNVIQIKLTPYYKQIAFRKYSQMPPPLIESQAPVGPVRLLPLNYIKPHEQVA